MQTPPSRVENNNVWNSSSSSSCFMIRFERLQQISENFLCSRLLRPFPERFYKSSGSLKMLPSDEPKGFIKFLPTATQWYEPSTYLSAFEWILLHSSLDFTKNRKRSSCSIPERAKNPKRSLLCHSPLRSRTLNIVLVGVSTVSLPIWNFVVFSSFSLSRFLVRRNISSLDVQRFKGILSNDRENNWTASSYFKYLER